MDTQHAPAARVSPFYSNNEAAAFLNLSPRTLEKLRVVGGGPPFRKLGRRVFYTMNDLTEWAGRRCCDSTSDPAWRAPQRCESPTLDSLMPKSESAAPKR
jgi:hypothetical protein